MKTTVALADQDSTPVLVGTELESDFARLRGCATTLAAMAKRKRVTTKDLLEATGVGQPTLYKWITKGILPPAERRVSSGTGDGVHARWPPGALARARWARKQRDAGLALDEIAALVERGEAPPVGPDAAD